VRQTGVYLRVRRAGNAKVSCLQSVGSDQAQSVFGNVSITMAYTIKEIFYTLQGEGAHTGRATTPGFRLV